MLVKWIRCEVTDRQRFDQGQRKWAGLVGEPGFRAQAGGWSRERPGQAHVFGFWESRAFYDSFMARSHERLAAAQSGTFKDTEVLLFDHRFDVKTGFEPYFHDVDLVRVAHSRVHEERVEHFTLVQRHIWNPVMAGSPGMVRGFFGEGPGHEFLVLSMWRAAAERGKYRPEGLTRLSARAQTDEDLLDLSGAIVELEPSWTV
ncbi:YdbC family protein [Streptomyces sp. NPDC049954]|uniref:YdbC family protein n=1 Tax=Streptomyces sp. NPDC049954 TaxID=3155779 RepID=UPI003436843E